MPDKTLKDLFVDELKDMLDAEQQLTKALPKLAKAANSEELADAFNHHLEQTRGHVERLHKVMELVGARVARKPCKAMQGLLAEGEELMEEEGSPDIRDLALIAAAVKVEHYEIATYGCLAAWATKLGESKAVTLLKKSRDEEVAADHKLTSIADGLDGDAAEEGMEMILIAKGMHPSREMSQEKKPTPKPRSR